AVEDEVRAAVRHGCLDVALEDALAEMARAGEMPATELLPLAHVDDGDRLARRPHALHVVDRQLADAGAGVVDQTEEAGRVLHDRLSTIAPGQRRANDDRSP